MSRRSAIEQIVIEEKTVCDAVLKLVKAREKASAWHLKWAKFESDEFMIYLFGKLAELRWLWNEIQQQFVDKQHEYFKTFKEIYHKERVIEDARKALQGCEAHILKIRKQLEKKNDPGKTSALEKELLSQLRMQEHLVKSIEGHTETLGKFKLEQIQRGLHIQAHAGLQLSEHLKHLFIAQMRLADILAASSAQNTATWQMVNGVLQGLSSTLGVQPPANGSLDPYPSASETPMQQKRSSASSSSAIADSPLASPVTSCPQTPDEKRRSFPFRPLPPEPVAADLPQADAGALSKQLSKSSSDVQRKTSNGPGPHAYRTSFYILDPIDDPIPRSRSVGSDSLPRRNPPPILEDPPVRERKSHSESQESGSDSGYADPGYADPIDAMKEYQQAKEAGNVVVSDPPYQTLEEIQQARLAHVLAQDNERDNIDDEPAYSRPIDCLMGLSNPVKVTSVSSQQHLSVYPLAFRRTASPDSPLLHGRGYKKKNHQLLASPSYGSDDTLSSFSSPEPADEIPNLSERRSSSLGSLLEPEELTRQKPKPELLQDNSRLLRNRVGSEGNLLRGGNTSQTSPVFTRSNTCSVANQNGATHACSANNCSPQFSPRHIPVPVRVTRLENGKAMLVSPAALDHQ